MGMREPRFVGRVKSIVPTSFLCRNRNNPITIKAELGDREVDRKSNEKALFIAIGIVYYWFARNVCTKIFQSDKEYQYDCW